MTKKHNNSKGRTPESMRAKSRNLLIVSIILALGFAWFYQERRSERTASAEASSAFQSGQAMGGRFITNSEVLYERSRDGFLTLVLPLIIIMLVFSAKNRFEASKLEGNLRGETDRG